MIGYKKIEQDDLQKGARLKAHWDGAFHEIIKMENDIVHYKGFVGGKIYKDSVSVILECFDLVEL